MDSKSDPLLIVFIWCLFILLGILIGIGMTCCYTLRVALPDKEATCEVCPEEDRLRCVVDDWDLNYIAGRCPEGGLR